MSALFSLNATELATLQERIRDGQLGQPVAIHPEGRPAGGLVRFRSFAEARRAEGHIA